MNNINNIKETSDAINKIVADWDPLNVGSFIARDEYTGYIPEIILVIKNGKSLYEYLSHLLEDELDAGFDSTNLHDVENLISICNKIIRAYNNT